MVFYKSQVCMTVKDRNTKLRYMLDIPGYYTDTSYNSYFLKDMIIIRN